MNVLQYPSFTVHDLYSGRIRQNLAEIKWAPLPGDLRDIARISETMLVPMSWKDFASMIRAFVPSPDCSNGEIVLESSIITALRD
jgi:hypothetical protein